MLYHGRFLIKITYEIYMLWVHHPVLVFRRHAPSKDPLRYERSSCLDTGAQTAPDPVGRLGYYVEPEPKPPDKGIGRAP